MHAKEFDLPSRAFDQKWAVVTGATSGIGLSTAHALAKEGYNLALIGRRSGRLEQIKKEIETSANIEVRVSSLDISSLESAEVFSKSHHEILKKVSVLVNNAGLAKGNDPVQSGSVGDFDQMIDTNIKGLLYFTRMLLPYMIEGGKGHIVNIGSVAGRWTYAGGAVYCATKFAVRAISEGLRWDLEGKNIRVTNIEPGMVETEFSQVRWGGDVSKAKEIYQRMTPLSPHDIADIVVWCLGRPAHVNIQEMVVFPTDQAAVGAVWRHSNQ